MIAKHSQMVGGRYSQLKKTNIAGANVTIKSAIVTTTPSTKIMIQQMQVDVEKLYKRVRQTIKISMVSSSTASMQYGIFLAIVSQPQLTPFSCLYLKYDMPQFQQNSCLHLWQSICGHPPFFQIIMPHEGPGHGLEYISFRKLLMELCISIVIDERENVRLYIESIHF